MLKVVEPINQHGEEENKITRKTHTHTQDTKSNWHNSTRKKDGLWTKVVGRIGHCQRQMDRAISSIVNDLSFYFSFPSSLPSSFSFLLFSILPSPLPLFRVAKHKPASSYFTRSPKTNETQSVLASKLFVFLCYCCLLFAS